MDILWLLASFGIILAGCKVFTNSVEWLGYKLHISEGATGSVLAALGTAMPETLIPIFALIFSSSAKSGQDISIGTILGAPFMLSTLAMFLGASAIVIFSFMGRRSRALNISERSVGLDLKFFILVYTMALISSLIYSRNLKLLMAIFLVAAYLFYLLKVLKEKREENSKMPECLYLCRLTGHKEANPHLAIIWLQFVLGVAFIVIGARVFVLSIEGIAFAAGISVAVLAFLIAPFATELPEKTNSILWYYRNKDSLALGNITGAMVFQSSIVVALGISLTDWRLNTLQRYSVVMALVSASILYLYLKWRKELHAYVLALGGLFYIVLTGLLLAL